MTAEKRVVYEFGGFALEVDRRLLWRGSEPILLTAKVFDTLLYLVEHRGETLDKDTLLRAIWPELVVEENNLTQNISTLRHRLGETRGENRFIATVPRKGYRFVAEVVERDAQGESTPARHGDRQPLPAADRSRRGLWISLALVIAVFATGAWFLRPRFAMTSPHALEAIGGTRDEAANLLYNQGRYALSRSTEASLQLAIDYFEKAIARDPGFALAHARMAEAYVTLGIWGLRAPGDTFPRARDSIVKALRVAPRLASAYYTSGQIKMQY